MSPPSVPPPLCRQCGPGRRQINRCSLRHPALLSWRGEVEVQVERRRSWRLENLEETRSLDILAARDRMLPAQVGGRRVCGVVVLHHPAGKPAHMAAPHFAPLLISCFLKAECQQSLLLLNHNESSIFGGATLSTFLLKIFGPRTSALCLSVPSTYVRCSKA